MFFFPSAASRQTCGAEFSTKLGMVQGFPAHWKVEGVKIPKLQDNVATEAV
jgi:hypothetical protein